MIRAVLFDMDGLMFDTEILAVEGWIHAGTVLGIEIPEALVLKARGLNAALTKQLLLEALGSDFDHDRARELKDQHMAQQIATNGLPVKKGLHDLLQYIKKEEILTAVATSTERNTANGYFKTAGVADYFQAAAFGNEVKKSKPDPEIFLLAASRLGVEPKDCMVLEDSAAGLEAARNAGMTAVMIPDLTEPTAHMLQLCHYRKENLSEVIPLLEELRKK